MSEKRATNGKITPTPKEKRIAKEFVRTGNKSEAYRIAYNAENMKLTTIHREAVATLSKPQVVSEIVKLMNAHGMSDKDLLTTHTEGLNATKVHGNELIEVPDYATRHKYLDTAYKLKGLTDNASKDKSSNTQIAFVVNVNDKRGEGAK